MEVSGCVEGREVGGGVGPRNWAPEAGGDDGPGKTFGKSHPESSAFVLTLYGPEARPSEPIDSDSQKGEQLVRTCYETY